ncbi:MAG TPA: TrkA family potassium uptake protein [Aeromonadales bacterium]|nr:TrkA family potassium uptake protein [Aeromonadales bacterium]
MSRKVAIFGFNKNGQKTAELMKLRGYKVTIFETTEKNINKAKELGYKVNALDITNPQQLLEAGVGPKLEEAVCCLDSDPDNLFLILTLRSVLADLKIVSVIHSFDLHNQFLTAGANELIDPYTITGRKIARQIERPVVAEIIEHIVLGRADLQTAEIKISQTSILNNQHLKQVELHHKFNLIVIGVLDHEVSGDFHFIHEGSNPKLDENDVLVVLGFPEDIEKFKLWAG